MLNIHFVLSQNATVGEKYSFGVFRALSHMTAISYGSSDTPTSKTSLLASRQRITVSVSFYRRFISIEMSIFCVLISDEVELWIVMTSIMSGALMYTVLVANTVALMTDADLTTKAYKNKVK